MPLSRPRCDRASLRPAFHLALLILVLVTVTQINRNASYCKQFVVPEDLFLQSRLQTNYAPYGYVAHALGSIDGVAYTNSKEAFEENYADGFRLFEVDLVRLKDGTVLAAHDNLEKLYGLHGSFAETTKNELAGKQYLHRYTPLTGRQLLSRLNGKNDAYLITDTKFHHFEILERLVEIAQAEFPCVLDRIIPHIGGNEGELARLEQIYPFKNYMLAVYRTKMTNEEILTFVRENNIRAVMMWWNTRYTPQFKGQLADIGAVTYVHSVKDPAAIAGFRRQGVGVYTDGTFAGG